MTYGCNKVSTTPRKTCALEDVDDIIPTFPKCQLNDQSSLPRRRYDVHHDIHATKLGPYLQTHSEHDTTRIARFQQVHIRSRTFSALEVNLPKMITGSEFPLKILLMMPYTCCLISSCSRTTSSFDLSPPPCKSANT